MSKDLYTWGEGLNGQLGNGATAAVLSPSFVSAGWVSVSCSRSHTLALKSNGTLWAWGNNSNNKLGTGGVASPPTLMPTQVGVATDWVKISAGETYSIALKSDGSMWGWGTTFWYEFGIGADATYATPTLINAGPWSEIKANDSVTQAIKPDGSLWSTGRNTAGALGINVVNTGPGDAGGGYVKVFTRESSNANDWLGFPKSTSMYNLALALKTNGAVRAAGQSELGSSITYIQYVANTWLSVASNNAINWGVRSDGTLWEWGVSWLTNTLVLTPRQIGSANNWVGVAVGPGGTVSAGAYNSIGELYVVGYRVGDGTSNTLTVPTLVLTGVADVSTGSEVFLALKIFIPPFWTNFQSTREVI